MKKEQIIDTYNKDLKGIMMSEKTNLKGSHTLWLHLYNFKRNDKIKEMENRLAIL